MKKIFFICLFSCSLLYGYGQFVLNNPSFEDEPNDATIPMGWFPCAKGTTPDILPGAWGVTEEANEGETYVGLITRMDGSFESIGQRLPSTLEKGLCYSFTFDLNKSSTYNGYNKPIYVRIYLGKRKCKKSQLIYQSELVDFDEWQEIKVKFTAEKKHKYILFEAYWPEDQVPRNGHILLDNISYITKCIKV